MQAELPRICCREYLPKASKHHFVIELNCFLTSLLLLKTILLRVTPLVGIADGAKLKRAAWSMNMKSDFTLYGKVFTFLFFNEKIRDLRNENNKGATGSSLFF